MAGGIHPLGETQSELSPTDTPILECSKRPKKSYVQTYFGKSIRGLSRQLFSGSGAICDDGTIGEIATIRPHPCICALNAKPEQYE